jgi:tetratricopeptide (TPR) repeat protein
LLCRNLGIGLSDTDPPRLEPAIRYNWAAVALRPNAGVYGNLALALAEKGELEAALIACRKGLELEPTYAELLDTLGTILERQDRPDQAIAAYQESVRLSPAFGPSHEKLVDALERAGRLDRVFAFYKECFARSPDAAEAYYHLGKALRKKGHLNEAVAAYGRAIESEKEHHVFPPPVVTAHGFVEVNEVGWYLSQSRNPALRNPGQARQVAAAAVEASGDDLEVVFQHAAWLLFTGDREAYRRLCSRSLERFPQARDPLRTAYVLVRMCSLDVKPAIDPERLTQLSQQAVNPAPHHRHALGLVAYRVGRFDEAISQFQQSLAWSPPWAGNVTNWLGMALALHRSGRRDEARTWLEKAHGALAQNPVNLDSPMHPHDRIACRLLLREAEEVLGKVDHTEPMR